MPEYLVEIDRTHTRTYAIKAASPEEALALLERNRYHKNVEFVEDEMDGSENGDTAVVFSDDDTRTVLLEAKDALSED